VALRPLPAAVAFLLLQPACASSALATGPNGEPWGDEWAVNLTGAYRVHGAPVVLRATYHIWSPWPIPYAGFEDRVTRLVVDDGLHVLPNGTATFHLVASWPTLVFVVTLQADGLSWRTRWTWDQWDACGLNLVAGTLEDAGTMRWGAPLEPITGSSFVGAAFADTIGPGQDQQYECYPGGGPI